MLSVSRDSEEFPKIIWEYGDEVPSLPPPMFFHRFADRRVSHDMTLISGLSMPPRQPRYDIDEKVKHIQWNFQQNEALAGVPEEWVSKKVITTEMLFNEFVTHFKLKPEEMQPGLQWQFVVIPQEETFAIVLRLLGIDFCPPHPDEVFGVEDMFIPKMFSTKTIEPHAGQFINCNDIFDPVGTPVNFDKAFPTQMEFGESESDITVQAQADGTQADGTDADTLPFDYSEY